MRLWLLSVSRSFSSNFQGLSFGKIKPLRDVLRLTWQSWHVCFFLHFFNFHAWLYCFSWIIPLTIECAGGVVRWWDFINMMRGLSLVIVWAVMGYEEVSGVKWSTFWTEKVSPRVMWLVTLGFWITELFLSIKLEPRNLKVVDNFLNFFVVLN